MKQKSIQNLKTRKSIKLFIDELSDDQCYEIANKLKGDEDMEIDRFDNVSMPFDEGDRLDLCKKILQREVDLKGSETFTEQFDIYMDGICEKAVLSEEIIQQLNDYSPDFFNLSKSKKEEKEPTKDEQMEQNENDSPPKAYPLYRYEMKSTPRGTCIIINNTFDHNEDWSRTGTNFDRDRLENVFKWLHFEVVVRDNMKADDICKLFDKLDGNICKDSDCFVCCILTHGGPLDIYGNDCKPVPRKKLRNSVLANSCKKLANKPKVFFIQACRKEKEEGPEDAQPADPDSRASASDICMVAATTEDTFAYRGKNSGSLFIQTVCDVLERHAHEDHLDTMLKRVNKALCEKKVCYKNKSSGETIIDQQVSDLMMGTLCGELYFNPEKSYEDYCKEHKIDPEHFDWL